MKDIGLMFNAKRVFWCYLLLIFGLSLMAFGVLSYYGDQRSFEASMTDDQIILRAKALGMVEMKELIEDEENDDQN